MTNPAMRGLLPLSRARHERLRSRSSDEDEASEVPPDGPIEIVRFEDEKPLELRAVSVTLYVPAPVGVPEMTPVAEFMLSPGGRPEAEKKVCGREAVTVKLNGVPELPDACGAELMTGIARTSTASVASIRPDELYREDGETPTASTRKVFDLVGERPESSQVAPSSVVAWPATVK
jgi:hypothetical protein